MRYNPHGVWSLTAVQMYLNAVLIYNYVGLITVLEVVLSGRQPREKEQCSYENLMSNNFRKGVVLKKVGTVN